MRNDIRNRYEQLLDQSHSGYPSVMHIERTGNRGRPRIVIDPGFLSFAYQQRSTRGIARFLGVGVTVVRNALLEYGIAQPGQNPFPVPDQIEEAMGDESLATQNAPLHPHLDHAFDNEEPEESNHGRRGPGDDIFDPQEIPSDTTLPPSILQTYRIPAQLSGRLSRISDSELDTILISLRVHFRRAGITILRGMLRQLGHHVSRRRIQEALLRIDPIQRTFGRTTIQRRVYSVPGPNALWHHDGQHGA